MNYSELLHDWLDGSLSGEHEEALFLALGKDTALRSEMQDLMRLRTAVQNDTAAFTPNPADTSAIFAKLGFAVPSDIPSLPPTQAAPIHASAAITASSAKTAGLTRTASRIFGKADFSKSVFSKAALKRFAVGFGSTLVSAVAASAITILLLDWRNGNSFRNSFGSESVSQNGAGTSVVAASGINDARLQQNMNNGAVPPPLDPNAAYFRALQQPNGFYGVSDTTLLRTNRSESQQMQRVVVREIVHEVVRYTSPFDLFSNPTRYAENVANAASTQEREQEMSAYRETLNKTVKESVQDALKESLRDLQTRTSLDNNSNNSTSAQSSQSVSNLASETKPIRSVVVADSTTTATALPATPQSEQPSGIQGILHNIRLGVRGMTNIALSAPSLEATAPAISFLNNVALSLHYALTPHHSIGVEAGQEAYFQQYRRTEFQDSYLVSQHPSQFWGGISYRYTMLPNSAFTPFAGATLGMAEYGAMGRTQLGCSYAPDAVTRFVLGVEASSLVYGHQGTVYASPKVGATYGISVRF